MTSMLKIRHRYQFSLRGMLLVMAAFATALGMFQYATRISPPVAEIGPLAIPGPNWASALGALLFGGLVGTIIGHACDNETGALLGGIVGGGILLAALLVLVPAFVWIVLPIYRFLTASWGSM
jgi:hypothetical protein